MRVAWSGIVCLVTATATFATEPSLRFQKEISSSRKPDESLVAVVLDAEVYAATQVGLADLRVQNTEGGSLPFFLRKSQDFVSKSVRRKTWTATNPALKPLDDGGLEITLELGEGDTQPNGLSVITPLRNFEQRVRVFTSVNGNDWEPSGAETVIFDYSRYMDVRSDSVPFVASPRRHVRIVIDDVTSEQESELLEMTRRLRGTEDSERTERVTIDRRPFRIDRIEFYEETSQQSVKGDRKLTYPIADFQVTEDSKTNQTIVTIDTRREPLTSFRLDSPSKNFSRSCAIEVQGQQGTHGSWQQIGEATLSRIDFKTLKREQLTVSFPETRQAQYRLVIDNRDSPPLTINGIIAEGNVYEVVYFATTSKSYRLAYGDSEAKAPDYDTAAIQSLLTERFSPEVVTLGNEEKSLGAKPVGWKLSHLLNDPRILTIVIGLLVLGLGWGLYGAVKRLDTQSPPADPDA